ncbi:MAG: sigma 54-interacting transcriptional regulator, partial [Syntrophaceticus sp.]
KGLFEMANGGTIFLDEISEMSDKLQTRLLRVLQEYEIMPLGGDRLVTVDVRVIAATNSDLRRLVAEKLFRADLFYRINVLTLVIPTLRERREDIPVLVNHFLNISNKKFQKNIKGIEAKGMDLFYAHDWPGNTRELQNIMERLVILTDGDYISADLVAESLIITPSEPYPLSSQQPQVETDHSPQQKTRASYDKKAIMSALTAAKGNKTRAAQILGISRTTLWRRMKKYNI